MKGAKAMLKSGVERLSRLQNSVPRTLKFLYVSAALDCVGWSCITPVLPVLYFKMGLSSSQVSYVAALTGVISLLSAGVQGSLSDKYSKVTLLKIANVSQMLCTAVLALYALDYINSWPLFVAIRALGAFFKMSMVVSQAFVVDYSHATDMKGSLSADSGKRATGFISTLMSASNVGFLAGPVLGGFLSQQAVSPFIFSLVVLSINLVALANVTDKHPSPMSLQVDPERGGVESICDENGNDSSVTDDSSFSGMALSERSSIGLRRPKRLASRDYDNDAAGEYGQQSAQDDSNEKDKGKSKKGTDNKLQNTPLLFLLHLKFAFQVSNTIYESLFAQHLRERLGTSPYQIGWMLSAVGLEAACVNAFVVPYLMSRESTSTWQWLMLCTALQTIGTSMWALALSVRSTFVGTLFIGFSSNVFLSLLQGMLGSLAAKSGGDSSSSRQSTPHARGAESPSSSSSSSSGMTYGLSTTMDRGARALAPLIGAAALDLNLRVPSGLFHLIGSLGPGASPGLSLEEAEAITVVHANQTLGLGLACAISGVYTLGLLVYHELSSHSGTGGPLSSALGWLGHLFRSSPWSSSHRTNHGMGLDLARASSVRKKGRFGPSGYPSSP